LLTLYIKTRQDKTQFGIISYLYGFRINQCGWERRKQQPLKQQHAEHFAWACEITNRVIEQVQYLIYVKKG
jgi:uncharacterized protein (DUF927 family)